MELPDPSEICGVKVTEEEEKIEPYKISSYIKRCAVVGALCSARGHQFSFFLQGYGNVSTR
jgi:hypothetical protein